MCPFLLASFALVWPHQYQFKAQWWGITDLDVEINVSSSVLISFLQLLSSFKSWAAKSGPK